jgi:hypothetical protein
VVGIGAGGAVGIDALDVIPDGFTPVGRWRGACGGRSFSSGLRSEPRGHLSVHVALQ